MERLRIIELLADALGSFPEVRLAILFGSFARGAATPESDIDVAVRAPGGDRLAIVAALEAATGREVDVVDLDEATIPLLEELVRDGVAIIERAPGAYATWRAGALADLETDRPWYARMRDAWLARVAREGI